MLCTQVPNFRGSKAKFHEFEDLPRNYLLSQQNCISKRNELHFFKGSCCDEAIDFWQTLRISPETTLKLFWTNTTKNLPQMILKKSPYSNGINSCMTHRKKAESWLDFLKTLKMAASQFFSDPFANFVETFLWRELHLQTQHEVPTTAESQRQAWKNLIHSSSDALKSNNSSYRQKLTNLSMRFPVPSNCDTHNSN